MGLEYKWKTDFAILCSINIYYLILTFIEEEMKAQRSYTGRDKADIQGLPVSRAHPISNLCFSSGHLMSS